MNIDTLYAGKPDIYKLLNAGGEEENHGFPAEGMFPYRPGWFYHPEQDTLVKSAEKIVSDLSHSVGRGSNLILNFLLIAADN